MFLYWFIFIYSAFFALYTINCKYTLQNYKNVIDFNWVIFFILLILMIGLRHQVGGDWDQYLLMLDSFIVGNYEELYRYQDPAFIYLNIFAAWSGLGIYLINFVSAVIFCLGLSKFSLNQSNPWLAILIAIPYLVIVVAMGYTRQGVAIGITLYAFAALNEENIKKYIIWIIIASLFHKSCIVLIPLIFLSVHKKNIIKLLLIVTLLIIFSYVLLAEVASFLIYGYLENEYQSSGTLIRLVMNVIPATIFLLFRNKFILSKLSMSFWTYMSIISWLFIFLLFISPSSTPIDRIALYWIPIQILVLSNLPSAFSNNNDKLTFLYTLIVILYCFLVLIVWLVYSDNSFAWLPYKFYPFIWLLNLF